MSARGARGRSAALCATQELDESQYWIEMLTGSGLVDGTLLVPLVREAEELMPMMIASVKTAKSRRPER